MMLHDADWAPSPRRVRIVLAEKGVAIERRMVDLRAGEHEGTDYRARNPRGLVPALELDGGELLTESAAIARYLEALHPEPPLFGRTPLEIARVEMWTRRIEAEGYAAAVYALRNTRAAFAGRAVAGLEGTEQLPKLAARARIMWAAFVAALDAHLAERAWIASDGYSFADVTALVTLDFARAARLELPADARHLAGWHARAAARPSAAA